MQTIEKKPTLYLMVILPIFVVGAMTAGIIPPGDICQESRRFTFCRSAAKRLSDLSSCHILCGSLALLLSNCVLYLVPPFRIVQKQCVAQARRPAFGSRSGSWVSSH